MTKILLAEDDVDVGETIVEVLESQNYFVDWERDGEMAHHMLLSYEYDAILLDWQLPGMAGPDICKAYRDRGGKAPIIFLTTRSAMTDKEVGFTAGADDYLPKPFDPKELSLRVKALLRRPSALLDSSLKKGPLELLLNEHRFLKNGTEVQLSPIEFALMEFFMKNEDTVFSAEAILDRVWPASSDRSPDTLRTCMKRLRDKIDTDPKNSFIENVYGVGYKFKVAEVTKRATKETKGSKKKG